MNDGATVKTKKTSRPNSSASDHLDEGRRLISLLFHDIYDRDPSESGFRGPGANRYKLHVSDFDEQLARVARARDDEPILLASPLRCEASDTVPFVLTFDDGGLSHYTIAAGRIEARGWRGHFFVTTAMIGRRGFLGSRQIRELRAHGHLIGTHSLSHPIRFARSGWQSMIREWRESRRVLSDLLGEDITLGSLPSGDFTLEVAQAAAEAGLQVLFTSEPETRAHLVDGCLVVGRFVVRRGAPPDFASRLAQLKRSDLAREWVIWNLKKTAKTVLGSSYPGLPSQPPAARDD
jgi:peptidoglycan/xylan/chitin deacetylase (PgdA/CDA1 family)